jgi:hypothetical protein
VGLGFLISSSKLMVLVSHVTLACSHRVRAGRPTDRPADCGSSLLTFALKYVLHQFLLSRQMGFLWSFCRKELFLLSARIGGLDIQNILNFFFSSYTDPGLARSPILRLSADKIWDMFSLVASSLPPRPWVCCLARGDPALCCTPQIKGL